MQTFSFQLSFFLLILHCKNKNKKGNNKAKNSSFMKKKSILLPLLLFFSVLPLTLFCSCDKDTNCYLDVNVVDEATQRDISGAIVKIYQDGGVVSDNGITGDDGVYSTHFKSPAIVKIKAILKVFDTQGNLAGERRGETSVRLLEGETLTAKVVITSQLHQ